MRNPDFAPSPAMLSTPVSRALEKGETVSGQEILTSFGVLHRLRSSASGRSAPRGDLMQLRSRARPLSGPRAPAREALRFPHTLAPHRTPWSRGAPSPLAPCATRTSPDRRPCSQPLSLRHRSDARRPPENAKPPAREHGPPRAGTPLTIAQERVLAVPRERRSLSPARNESGKAAGDEGAPRADRPFQLRPSPAQPQPHGPHLLAQTRGTRTPSPWLPLSPAWERGLGGEGGDATGHHSRGARSRPTGGNWSGSSRTSRI